MPTRSFCAAHCHLTAALAAPPCPLPQYRPWYNTILWNTSGCCDMYNNQFWSMMRALFGYTGERWVLSWLPAWQGYASGALPRSNSIAGFCIAVWLSRQQPPCPAPPPPHVCASPLPRPAPSLPCRPAHGPQPDVLPAVLGYCAEHHDLEVVHRHPHRPPPGAHRLSTHRCVAGACWQRPALVLVAPSPPRPTGLQALFAHTARQAHACLPCPRPLTMPRPALYPSLAPCRPRLTTSSRLQSTWESAWTPTPAWVSQTSPWP